MNVLSYFIYPQINWVTFVNNILSVVNKTVDENDSITMYDNNYFKRLHILITNKMKTDSGKK